MVHKCESCKRWESQWILKSTLDPKEKPYKVCSNCLLPLVGEALDKKQFKNLLKSGHKDEEFLLHEDFYDEEGRALQPVKFRR